MSQDRKHPGIALYLACVVAVPVIYFASIGPVVWMYSRIAGASPEWVETSLEYYFLPAELVHDHSPEPVQQAMEAYVELFDES